ncbi:MAG: STAS/SEC14 domain-containing protein [Phycisphaeraceae bacterium]|nr:STAS/SEC14 domain-containing protein [Phycisphaeraceae bacterium]
MLSHSLDTSSGILYLRPGAPLEKEDFKKLAREVDPLIEKRGSLAGILIEAPEFPGWESFGALAAHLRFVRDHHEHVKKIAVVTDSSLGAFAERIASHFVAATIRHFPAGSAAEAERWITS